MVPGDSALMDTIASSLWANSNLRSCGEGVVDLTVRNLAMSAAMVVHHRKQADDLQALIAKIRVGLEPRRRAWIALGSIAIGFAGSRAV